MGKKIFNFYGRFNVEINASESLLERIAANIHTEIKDNNAPLDGIVNINEPKKYETIIRDKRYPYLTVSTDGSQKSITYYRYNTFIRTINLIREGFYEVDVNTKDDEAAGLICFRHFCNNHPSLDQNVLVHASLVNLNGEGILMPGNTRSGKTTLMVHLMQNLGAELVSEDNVYVEKPMKGIYFPKVPRVRFVTVRDSCLAPLLKDIQATEATQYWDIESIEKVVAEGKLNTDGGLAISRRKIAEMCGVGTLESTDINKVIFPSYSEREFSFEEIDGEEAFCMLERFGREKKRDLDSRDISEEPISLDNFKKENIRFYTLKFGGMKDLEDNIFSL